MEAGSRKLAACSSTEKGGGSKVAWKYSRTIPANTRFHCSAAAARICAKVSDIMAMSRFIRITLENR